MDDKRLVKSIQVSEDKIGSLWEPSKVIDVLPVSRMSDLEVLEYALDRCGVKYTTYHNGEDSTVLCIESCDSCTGHEFTKDGKAIK